MAPDAATIPWKCVRALPQRRRYAARDASETEAAAFWDFCDDVDRLRLRKQAQRTARRLPSVADHLPFGLGGLGVLRGKGDRGCFRNMRVVRLEPQNAPAAEPRGHAIDEARYFPLRIGVAIEADRFRVDAFHAASTQTNEIITKAWIQRIGERVELFVKKTLDDGRLARRFGRFDDNAPHDAIDAEKARLETARAAAVLFQH